MQPPARFATGGRKRQALEQCLPDGIPLAERRRSFIQGSLDRLGMTEGRRGMTKAARGDHINLPPSAGKVCPDGKTPPQGKPAAANIRLFLRITEKFFVNPMIFFQKAKPRFAESVKEEGEAAAFL